MSLCSVTETKEQRELFNNKIKIIKQLCLRRVALPSCKTDKPVALDYRKIVPFIGNCPLHVF